MSQVTVIGIIKYFCRIDKQEKQVDVTEKFWDQENALPEPYDLYKYLYNLSTDIRQIEFPKYVSLVETKLLSHAV